MRKDRGYGFGNRKMSFPHLGYKNHKITDYFNVLEDPGEYKATERRDSKTRGYGFEDLENKFRLGDHRVLICYGDSCVNTSCIGSECASKPSQVDESAKLRDFDDSLQYEGSDGVDVRDLTWYPF